MLHKPWYGILLRVVVFSLRMLVVDFTLDTNIATTYMQETYITHLRNWIW